ncbi:EpsD family peptidyl-prolyl cis-trans isomerase [Ampullimonas aquatilis]|uniref:EpsD family peptidyl-prolyl cis-trans isomerase n=1 Tax=Ampullimonas aquatilis TaxID=1341549 RepID=UPI003C77AC3E
MNKLKLASIIFLALATLSACGDKKEHGATQVAAKVNDKEITIHQINGVLSRTPNLPQDRAQAAGKQILQSLIDQELLIQQAQEQKLDRDANVMQAIESAKREILARAYVERLGTSASKPSADEIKKFYKEHPELFSERKVFQLTEGGIMAAPKDIEKLKPLLEKAKTIADVAAIAKENNLSFGQSQVTKPAEMIELEILPALTKLKEGDLGYLPMNGGIRILQVNGTSLAPLDEATATPRIEQFLQQKKRNDAGAEEVKRLRGVAKIEYVGDYAPDAKASQPATPAKSEAKPADDSMSRGVSGLK